ncbi:malate dehydrogenase, partial [Proteus mirabilis]|nr:malate dehydrogenase [Proteus mirabilis]
IECTYTEGDGEHARFFAQPVRLGKNGVEEYLPIGQLSDFEKQSLNGMLDVLKKDIILGEEFINK